MYIHVCKRLWGASIHCSMAAGGIFVLLRDTPFFSLGSDIVYYAILSVHFGISVFRQLGERESCVYRGIR